MTNLTTFIITLAVLAVITYLIGSVNSSIIISKFIGTDIRNHGSGNAGATNMLRTYGKKLGVFTLLCDALKGVIAVGLAMIVLNLTRQSYTEHDFYIASIIIKCVCAFFVVIGHNYPIFFQFKGGKGISTSAAIIFMLDWRCGLIVLIGALTIMAITRYVSLGSIIGALLFPISVCFYTFFIDKDLNYILVITSVVICLLAIYRHKANIVRLINKTESKFGQKNKEDV